MKKVHVLIWNATREIGGVFLDRGTALAIAKRNNERRSPVFMEDDTFWEVETFELRGS